MPPQQGGYPVPPPAYPPAYYPAPPLGAAPPACPLEERIGTRATTIIGIVFILLGVLFGLVYTFTVLSSGLAKCIIAYAVGAALLATGDITARKKQVAFFSTGLCAGGTAVLFTTTAVGYFVLNALPFWAAIALCLVFFVLSAYLSLHHNSQVIGIFSLIGGYLPTFLLLDDFYAHAGAAYGIMAYFILLTVLVLLLAGKREWPVIQYTGLILQLVSCYRFLRAQNWNNFAANIIFLSVIFIVYMAVINLQPLAKKQPLRINSLIVLVLATAGIYGLLLSLLYRSPYHRFTWAVTLALALVFFALSQIWRSAVPADKGTRGMFFATALAFLLWSSALFFRPGLITLGWMLEAVALCVYGILANRKGYKIAGLVTAGVSVVYFLVADSFTYWLLGRSGVEYLWKYSVITLGLFAIVLAFAYKNRAVQGFWAAPQNLLPRSVRNAATINLWLYLLFVVRFLFTETALRRAGGFWQSFGVCLVTLLAAYLLKNVVHFGSELLRVFGCVLYSLGLVFSLGLNLRPTHAGGIPLASSPAATAALCMLFLLNAASLFALYDLITAMVPEKKHREKAVPLCFSLYSLFLATLMAVVQFRLGATSAIVSVIWVLWAFSMVLFGFVKRSSFMRIGGLILAFVALAKLIFIDLSFLQGIARVVSFFAFGLLFLGISFAYHLFSKMLLPAAAPAPQPPAPYYPPAGGYAPPVPGYAPQPAPTAQSPAPVQQPGPAQNPPPQ
ncbi:MAG: DUF2339 domain-containing protein [Oscillospiraceae bacterium]